MTAFWGDEIQVAKGPEMRAARAWWRGRLRRLAHWLGAGLSGTARAIGGS